MANWQSVSILSRKREDAILVVVEAVEKWARAKRCPLFHSLLSTGSEGCQTTFTEKKLHNHVDVRLKQKATDALSRQRLRLSVAGSYSTTNSEDYSAQIRENREDRTPSPLLIEKDAPRSFLHVNLTIEIAVPTVD